MNEQELRDAIYRELEEQERVFLTPGMVYNAIKPPMDKSNFYCILFDLYAESVDDTNLEEICRERFEVGRSRQLKKRHHEVFDGIPPAPVYYLKKRVEEGAKILAERGHVRSILHRRSLSRSLRRSVYNAYIMTGKSNTNVSKIYFLLKSSNAPLKRKEIAEKTGIKPSIVHITLHYMRKKDLVKKVKRGFWTLCNGK